VNSCYWPAAQKHGPFGHRRAAPRLPEIAGIARQPEDVPGKVSGSTTFADGTSDRAGSGVHMVRS